VHVSNLSHFLLSQVQTARPRLHILCITSYSGSQVSLARAQENNAPPFLNDTLVGGLGLEFRGGSDERAGPEGVEIDCDFKEVQR
jgi:hypothetical protein